MFRRRRFFAPYRGFGYRRPLMGHRFGWGLGLLFLPLILIAALVLKLGILALVGLLVIALLIAIIR